MHFLLFFLALSLTLSQTLFYDDDFHKCAVHAHTSEFAFDDDDDGKLAENIACVGDIKNGQCK